VHSVEDSSAYWATVALINYEANRPTMPAIPRCAGLLGSQRARTLGRERAGRDRALNGRVAVPHSIRLMIECARDYAPDPGAKRSSHWRVSSITAFDAEARRCISVSVVVRGRRSMARAFSSEPQ
jgi:hypothetical protein